MSLRHSKITVDLDAIRHNYLQLKKHSNNRRCIAVIKANAYGHGAVQVAQALSSEAVMADAFAVATVAEAVELRQAGIEQKIVVLGGFIDEQESEQLKVNQLDSVVHSSYQIEMLLNQADRNINIWLKINSGMGRLGFNLSEVKDVLMQLSAFNITLMTHLASADDLNDDKTKQQLALIKNLGLDQYDWSIANSAGTLGWLESHKQWNRLGISLYGINPFMGKSKQDLALQPAMQFESQLVAIYQRNKGDTVGYGASYQCDKDMIIGVVGAGYGDGYPRFSAGNGMVEINQQQVPIIGRVSMDMIILDLSSLSSPKIGDSVILWGKSPTAKQVAINSETIAYEICCNAGAHIQAEYINTK